VTTGTQTSLRADEFRIRQANENDVEALVRLINVAFVVEQIALEGDRVDAEKLAAYLDRGRFLLLEDASSLLGCVYAERRSDRGYVGLLSVEPTLQMRGLGRRLMAAAEQHLLDAGCVGVDLRIISARPELLRFYGKLGYTETGISPMPEDAPLKMACHFIHLSKKLR
jgi:GNAT superfamily N-acetyltransferase